MRLLEFPQTNQAYMLCLFPPANGDRFVHSCLQASALIDPPHMTNGILVVQRLLNGSKFQLLASSCKLIELCLELCSG